MDFPGSMNHEKRILHELLRLRRLTRTELCARLGLSPAAIVRYTRDLIGRGFIREGEFASAEGAGRRSAFLELNPDKGLAGAIALYRDRLQAGLLSADGQLLYRREYRYSEGSEAAGLLKLIYRAAADTKAEALRQSREILGIGIAMGGHLDPATGISHQYLFAKNWYSVPIRDMVGQKCGLPVFLIKDSNAAALGDACFGKAVGVSDFLSVWMGSGLGLGIFIDGRNYAGAAGYAGELGHTRGGDSGRLCYCGRRGCLESSCSEAYALERCRDGLQAGVVSSMNRLCGDRLEDLRIENAIAAANEGDRLSRTVFTEIGGRLGLSLSDLVNIFNPSLIVFRGPLIDGNRFLFDTIERSIRDSALQEAAAGLKMTYAETEEYIHLKGICALVLGGIIDTLQTEN